MIWLSDLKVSDIQSEKLQAVARFCGMPVAISLMEHFPGIRLYIPNYAKIKNDSEYVKKHYTGSNSASIAVHLGITTARVKYLHRHGIRFKRDMMSNFYSRAISEKCGFDVAVKIVQHFSGKVIYIPRDPFSAIRRQKILQEFKGNNTTDLALRYNVSYRYVEKIISSFHTSREVQTDLFIQN